MILRFRALSLQDQQALIEFLKQLQLGKTQAGGMGREQLSFPIASLDPGGRDGAQTAVGG